MNIDKGGYMSETVVTSSDVAPVKVPKAFKELKADQVKAAAEHFGTDTEGNMAAQLADLESSGVTFQMYLQAFYPDDAEPVEDEAFEMPELTDVENWPDAEEGGEEVTEKVVTVTPTPNLKVSEKYLIKFIGENPYFEFEKYKFSQEKPYGIMSANDAQRALVEEPTKFRQAYPAELEEFYS